MEINTQKIFLEPCIFNLFPIPIYMTKIIRNFTEKENKFIEQCRLDLHKNTNNMSSKNNYVLNSMPFETLKKELTEIIKDYFSKIVMTSNDIEPYITQSWLNFTEINESHHTHNHANSYVSGVLYINVSKNDGIVFYKNKYDLIKPEVKNYNLYNSETWKFSIENLEVILFPSYLSHSVDIKKESGTRISLAFNSFIKGKFGSNKELTELEI